MKILEHKKAIKNINLQLEKQGGNCLRNTIKKIENDLKEHEVKIKEQLNSDKAVGQKIKEILKTLE